MVKVTVSSSQQHWSSSVFHLFSKRQPCKSDSCYSCTASGWYHLAAEPPWAAWACQGCLCLVLAGSRLWQQTDKAGLSLVTNVTPLCCWVQLWLKPMKVGWAAIRKGIKTTASGPKSEQKKTRQRCAWEIRVPVTAATADTLLAWGTAASATAECTTPGSLPVVPSITIDTLPY